MTNFVKWNWLSTDYFIWRRKNYTMLSSDIHGFLIRAYVLSGHCKLGTKPNLVANPASVRISPCHHTLSQYTFFVKLGWVLCDQNVYGRKSIYIGLYLYLHKILVVKCLFKASISGFIHHYHTQLVSTGFSYPVYAVQIKYLCHPSASLSSEALTMLLLLHYYSFRMRTQDNGFVDRRKKNSTLSLSFVLGNRRQKSFLSFPV